jgi:hypothetical protein
VGQHGGSHDILLFIRYIDKLAEPRMQEAVGRGEFDNLPGTGKPLVLDDDTFVPPELRVAYRVLQNAGYLPHNLQLRSEISDLETKCVQC